MANLLAMTVTLLVAAPGAGSTADATSLAAPAPARRAQNGPRLPPDLSWPSRFSTDPRPVAPSTPLPRDLSSHPAWERYFRGRKLYAIGQALAGTGGVLAGMLVLATPLVVLTFGPPKDSSLNYRETVQYKAMLGMTVGLGVPIVVLFYSGISLLVKGGRLRDRAVLEIFGPPDPKRSSVRLELGPGSLGLVGRF